MPTLEQVLRALPAHVHVLIELKYPTAATMHRLHLPYPERNYFVDRVLDVLLRRAFSRSTADAAASAPTHRRFSLLSFDPEICLMLQRKQRLFRVWFLNCEHREAEDVTPRDPRRYTADGGMRFAARNGLAGVVLLNSIILERPEVVRTAHERYRLGVMCYGRSNAEPACARRLVAMRVDGIIADKVGYVAAALADDLAKRRAEAMAAVAEAAAAGVTASTVRAHGAARRVHAAMSLSRGVCGDGVSTRS